MRTGIDGPRGWLHHLDRPLPRQRIADTVSAATETSDGQRQTKRKRLKCSDRKRSASMRPPSPTAATMRARRMIDAMTGIGGKLCEAQIIRHNRQTRTV